MRMWLKIVLATPTVGHRTRRLVGIGLTVFAAAVCGFPSRGSAALTLAEGGRSSYRIYRAADSPKTVHEAAEELQRVLRIATGVQLPIQDEPGEPMIALGDTPAARAVDRVPTLPEEDAYRIFTRGRNLYVRGNDTPDAGALWEGWVSRGTLFGTFDLLERVAGVRWLLPGAWGEDVPRQPDLVVPEFEVSERPDFRLRALSGIQEQRSGAPDGPAVAAWLLHNRVAPLGDGQRVPHAHAWNDYITCEQLARHPEFRALDARGRPRTFPNYAAVKFCTTNPELIRAFADAVSARLAKHPERRTVSISPSDGGDFCQCPRCQALVSTDPHGRPSYTRLLLEFYKAVAKVVGAKHPDRLLAGYVYYNYMYPPEVPVEIAPNLRLVWAPLNYYGWGLAKPVYAAEFPVVSRRWVALHPELVYHNYSTWMRSLHGGPLPPGLGILELELPSLFAAGVRSAEMVGIGAWGYGAPTNYLLARQLWSADADVRALYREWLQRAYGPGWRSMERLFAFLEGRILEHKRGEPAEYRGEQYEVNVEFAHAVYAPLFGEMERLYRAAVAEAATEPQRHRLEMFGDNLTVLHHSLRRAGLLEHPERSSFYQTDEALRVFLRERESSFALERNVATRPLGPLWAGQWPGPQPLGGVRRFVTKVSRAAQPGGGERCE